MNYQSIASIQFSNNEVINYSPFRITGIAPSGLKIMITIINVLTTGGPVALLCLYTLQVNNNFAIGALRAPAELIPTHSWE